jgi:UDPglucose 6-dehydrogenase
MSENSDENITLIGIGRLGLCLGMCMELVGYNVMGVDISQSYIDSINNKTFKSLEPNLENLVKKSKNFVGTTDLEKGLKFSDNIFILVQTPNNGGYNFYDHTILGDLLLRINEYKVENKHLVICSTVMPEYIEKIGKNLISDCLNTTLNYNPEFIAQGDIIQGIQYPDLVLIGEENNDAGLMIEKVNSRIALNNPKICRLTPTEAEIAKISINGFITMKITYANMIGDLCNKLNCNSKNTAFAIGCDSRIGNKYFKPGESYGGPCFPRDTKALNQVLKNNNIITNILEDVDDYNEKHIGELAENLYNLHLKQYVSNYNNKNTLFIENICFKPNSKVPIIEESCNLKIARYLKKKYPRTKIIIKDNKHLIDMVRKEYGDLFEYYIC